LIHGLSALNLESHNADTFEQGSSRSDESSSVNPGYPLVRDTKVQTKFRPLIWVLRTLENCQGDYSTVSNKICQEYSMVWKRKKFSRYLEFAEMAGAITRMENVETGERSILLAQRHQFLREPVAAAFVPLLESIMKPHLSSNPLCSQVANLLLRHKAQPLADKTWRIYLAEAVDAGLVETGTEGIGREWVKVADDLWM
ncbi:hypothetical protein JCM5353_000058, partial [Sporobolomyces roseus]